MTLRHIIFSTNPTEAQQYILSSNCNDLFLIDIISNVSDTHSRFSNYPANEGTRPHW